MEQSLINAVQTLGLPCVIALLIWYDGQKKHKENKEEIQKKDSENRKYTDELITGLKTDIKDLKEENKEDKEMFNKSILSFENAVKEFSSVNKDITGIHSELTGIKTDIAVIKSKVEK